VTLYDPPRPDAKQLIASLRGLGIAVKMLTGDALAVANEIARGVGLPNIRRVADLKAAGAKPGNEAVDLLAGADGFAEVFPEDKYIVVQHLQDAMVACLVVNDIVKVTMIKWRVPLAVA
jgi:H+-transporting ATPase